MSHRNTVIIRSSLTKLASMGEMRDEPCTRWKQNSYEGGCSTRAVRTTSILVAVSHGKFEIWDPVDLVVTLSVK
jgi:hypothetical protein